MRKQICEMFIVVRGWEQFRNGVLFYVFHKINDPYNLFTKKRTKFIKIVECKNYIFTTLNYASNVIYA